MGDRSCVAEGSRQVCRSELPETARVIIVASSDSAGHQKIVLARNHFSALSGAELNQMLTFVVTIRSETPSEPDLLLFAGMNDHLYAAGLLDPPRGD